jgi:hypothetical protein
MINQERNSFVFRTSGSAHIVLPIDGVPYEKQFYMGEAFDEFFLEKNLTLVTMGQIQDVLLYGRRHALDVYVDKCAHIYLRENDKILNEV